MADEGTFQGFVQGGLVALDRQQVVSAHVPDGARDLALGAHRVDADQAALDRQGLQQRRDGRDLVALVGDLLLAQDDPQAGGEGADHVHRAQPAHGRAPQALAVDGHVLPEGTHDPAHPASEHLLEVLGVEDAEDPVEGVVGGDAVFQPQEAAQPRLLDLRPLGHVLEALHLGEDGADGNHQHFHQVVALAVAHPRVLDLGQALHQGRLSFRGHVRSRKRRE